MPKRPAKVKLYEITALVHVTAVIAAVNAEDALQHVESWESAWLNPANADNGGVSDVDLHDERECDVDVVVDNAHDITSALRRRLRETSSAK